MTIQLPQELEAALKAKATAQGLTAESYLRELLERELAATPDAPAKRSLISGYGSLAECGPMPSAEEFDENRWEMFKNFGKDF
jgi:plasmid stability protein